MSQAAEAYIRRLLGFIERLERGDVSAAELVDLVDDWWVEDGAPWDEVSRHVEFHDYLLQDLHNLVSFYVEDPVLRRWSPIYIDAEQLRSQIVPYREAIEEWLAGSGRGT